MNLKLAIFSLFAALFFMTSTANAMCMFDGFGYRVCGVGMCMRDAAGEVACAPTLTGQCAYERATGAVVCGAGMCMMDSAGYVACATSEVGQCILDDYGAVACGGGQCMLDNDGSGICSGMIGGYCTYRFGYPYCE